MESYFEEKNIEEFQVISDIQKRIDKAPDKTQEQIEILGKPYQPSSGDMVELPDKSKGGISFGAPDKDGNYEIELESGGKVYAPANKIILCGCWTIHKRYLTGKEKLE